MFTVMGQLLVKPTVSVTQTCPCVLSGRSYSGILVFSCRTLVLLCNSLFSLSEFLQSLPIYLFSVFFLVAQEPAFLKELFLIV